MKRKLLASLASAAAIMAGAASPAFAWHYGLSGSGQCQPDGSFKITWTVDNTTENEALHITTSSNESVVPAGTNVAASSTQAFYQTASGTAPGVFNLSLTGNYPSDQTPRTQSATVMLQQACGQPGMGGGEEDKVTLCHATDSNTNPYVKITVDSSGAYNGHYSEHQGPIYPGSGGKWGDIIPTFTYQEQSYSLNWTTQGQAIYNNGCVIAGGQGGGDTTSTPTTPTVASTPSTRLTAAPVAAGGLGGGAAAYQAPVGAVSAGEGGAAFQTNVASVLGMLSSISVAALGLRRFARQV